MRALYVGALDAAWLGEGPVETDARPVLEFLAARSHSGRVATPFTGTAWVDFSTRIARRAEARAGLLLQAASALEATGRRDAAAARFSEAANLLPASLVSGAPPDPTVAELWHEGD